LFQRFVSSKQRKGRQRAKQNKINERKTQSPKTQHTYSEVIALIVADTSAAPFPSASSVTPENLGGKPSVTLNISRAGEK
jgi:hypothetical protein